MSAAPGGRWRSPRWRPNVCARGPADMDAQQIPPSSTRPFGLHPGGQRCHLRRSTVVSRGSSWPAPVGKARAVLSFELSTQRRKAETPWPNAYRAFAAPHLRRASRESAADFPDVVAARTPLRSECRCREPEHRCANSGKPHISMRETAPPLGAPHQVRRILRKPRIHIHGMDIPPCPRLPLRRLYWEFAMPPDLARSLRVAEDSAHCPCLLNPVCLQASSNSGCSCSLFL